MSIRSIFFSVLFVFILAISSTGFAEVSVRASVDRDKATLEDEIFLTIRVEGSRKATEPVFPSVPAFKIISSGTSSSIQIINGAVTMKKEYTYILIPEEEGDHTIDSISVFSGGREYKTQPLKISIVRSMPGQVVPVIVGPSGRIASQDKQKQDKGDDQLDDNQNGSLKQYGITTEVQTREPYVNEQILFTFRFYTSVNVGTATLTLPEFKDFWSEEVLPEKKYYKNINKEKYVVSEKVIALYPLRSGKLTIGETILHVEVPDKRRSPYYEDSFFSLRRKPPMRKKNLRAKPIVLDVKPLPDNVPEDFSNLVGQFDLSVNISDQEIKMGESTTLSIEIAGKGNIKDAILPKILGLSLFKVYDDKPLTETVRKETGIEGKKSFKKALVPIQAGEINIPSFTISYFDPNKEDYVQVSGQPLLVKVLPSEGESLNVAGATTGPLGDSSGIPVIAEDIATIHTDIVLNTESLWGRKEWLLVLIVFVVPPVLFFGIFLFQRRITVRRENAAFYKSRQSYKRFIAGVGRLRKSKLDERESISKLLDLIKQYIGDRCGVHGPALAASDIQRNLEKRGVGRDLTSNLKQIVNSLEEIAYLPARLAEAPAERAGKAGGGESEKMSLSEWIKDVSKLLKVINKKVKK